MSVWKTMFYKIAWQVLCVSLDRVCWMCCWIFCLYWFFYVLSMLEILIWKKFIISLTLMTDLSISSLNSIGFCFVYFKAYLCEVLIILFSWRIVLFTIKMCLSSSLINLELYLIWYWYSDTSFLLPSIYPVCHFSIILLIFLCSCILAVFCTVYTADFLKDNKNISVFYLGSLFHSYLLESSINLDLIFPKILFPIFFDLFFSFSSPVLLYLVWIKLSLFSFLFCWF